jgi:alpha-beta hydrolase superfamily lysophospholipase
VPVVVLTHGSGPHDRDETIGPNKPFRDIAHGLAAAGIASLRYDKRTFARRAGIDLMTFTVEQEVIADAVAAVRFARAQPGVDSARGFLLGHSLGATLAPLVAERLSRDLRGVILLAPAARPLDSVAVEQVAFRMRVAGQPDSAIAAQAAELERAFARVRSGAAADSALVFGATAHYWRDLFARRPLDILRALAVPVLVLQGGKDYQVTRADYERVQAALTGKAPGLGLAIWFPELNHLFIKVAGASTGAEYGRPGTVDGQVMTQMARWIKER